MLRVILNLITIQVPGILTGLQKSVQAVLLGRSILPDWLHQGIKMGSEIDKFIIEELPEINGIYYNMYLNYMYVNNTCSFNTEITEK